MSDPNLLQTATITSASGETAFVKCAAGRGFIAVTGTISAGAVLLIVKPEGVSTEFPLDTIDATRIAENANEAGTGYSFGAMVDVPHNAQIALKANAAFTGSVTAVVNGDPY